MHVVLLANVPLRLAAGVLQLFFSASGKEEEQGRRHTPRTCACGRNHDPPGSWEQVEPWTWVQLPLLETTVIPGRGA